MTGETETEIPETGAVFTFGKSKIANNVPSRLWLKNDTPVHISCGQSHSAFVTEQGRLFVFGNNNRGQLGLQTKGPVNKPTCVKVLKGERAQFVSCGTDHTLVSTSQGEIFAAGGNSEGQLGLGHCNDSFSFQRLHPFCDYAPIKLLSAGGHTSAALTEDGRLFLWGENSVGQLGLGNDSHALLPQELKLGQSIQWVSCGYRHSALVTDNGDVFTFGESADGRLGLSAHQLANHSHPQRVESLHGVLQVACGGKHTLALTEDGLYSFGRGEFGQLGLGTFTFVADTPVAVGHFRKGRVTYVTCDENHSALITDSGLLYTFGDGRHGKLGHGDENFTNQFSPTVCQRFFDYSVMTVACGSSHMLVFARPRHQESEEICLEDEDVTYSYLERCYNSMVQGQTLEHIPDPAPALVSQPTFLPSSLPTSHRWSLSTRARRRQRESSSAQFGPEFCNLPPPTTGFTALALTGNILQPRSPTDNPKRFKTEASVESPSTSITLPAITQITKNEEDCHCVGTSENTISEKTHEENRHSGMMENIPHQAPPTKVQAGSVYHSSVTDSPPSSNLKNKKPRSRDPKNPAMAEEHYSVTASRSKMQSKKYKKPIQIANNKSKRQAVEVRLSSDRKSAEEKEVSSETCSTNIDPSDKISKADKYNKVQHADSSGQEVSALAEMEKKTESKPIKIQKTFSRSSPVQEVEQVRRTPTKVKEVKSPKNKEMDIPVGATKRVKSPVKVQDVPSSAIEVSKVESTPQADAQRDVKPSLGNAQEVRSTLINTQEQGNSTPVKIPAKMQSTPKKGKEKNDVDTEESLRELAPKKAKKKRLNVERAPISQTAPKAPSPLSVPIPTQISKAKKGKPVKSKSSNFQLKPAIPEQEKTEIKRENDSKMPQASDITFPPIKTQKSGGTAKKRQSASNLQSDQKNSQSPTDKVLTEQKHEFPSIKSLAPERGHSFSRLWSNNQSATNKSSATKETESSSGKLLSPSSSSPQHKQSPLKENKFARKTVEPEEPDRKPQAEQSIMGSVVSSLPAVAIASAAPLLIKAAEVLSETQPEARTEMSSHASVSNEPSGSNILLEQEVDQDSTVQDVSAIEEMDDSLIKQQSAQDEQNKLVSGDGNIEEEENVKDSETEREEEGGEEESLAEEEDELEGVRQEEENSAVEDEEERESENYEETGENTQQGEEESEEEEAEEEGSEAAGEEEDDSNSRQSSESEGEMKGEASGDDTEREEEEQSEGQEKEESEEGETDEKEEEDGESGGGEDKEEERESWDEGSEREVENEEKTDAEEEQEREREKTDEQSESDNDTNNERSDVEEGESEEKDESVEEDEENEAVEGEGEQEEKGEGESEEEDEVPENEVEEENQEEESHNEEEEERRNQTKEVEEEEENNGEEEGEEDKEEEVDEEENNEELGDEDGVTIKSEEEESVREKEEQQNEVEAENEEKISETDGDEDREKQEGKEHIEEEDKKEGKIDTGEETFREEENLDILETQETERGDEDDETDKLNEMEEESGHEEEVEEEEIDQKEENKTTNEEEEEGGEEVEEEEEETEQKNKNVKTKKNRRKQRETSEEEEEQEGESEEEEEETEQEEKNIKTERNRRKPRETREEEEKEEQEEESEEEEEESEQEEKNIKTERNRRKPRETSEEEEEQGEETEEEKEEEEIEQKEKNIKIETSEEEEEQSEGDEEEETEHKVKNTNRDTHGSDEEEEQEEEGEEEEEEEPEYKVKNTKRDKHGSDEEEEQEEEGEEEEEEETEYKVKNTKRDKHGSDEEEQEEEGEEEEEETERKEENIKTKNNEWKRRETSEEEEEQEEETEEEEEEEEEEGEEQEGEEEEEEEEEEKTKKVPKQKAKPGVLPPRKQTNAQRDRQKTRQRHQHNVKGKKQTDSGAQDPQFWNNVLPQYLNLK